jgi:outer membrane lipoprotein-sorting protein
MTKYITIALATVLSMSTFNMNAQDDPKSRLIVDKMIAKSKDYSTFMATFTNRLQSKADGLDVKNNGTIMAKGKKFKLQMEDYTVFCDGETVWSYSDESNEVTITDPEELEQELDPSKMLTMYESGFKSQYVEEKTMNGKVVEVIKLFPLEAGEKPYHTVVMTIDKAKLEPVDINILYKDGNEVSYSLKSFKANTPMDDALFTFPASRYPGAEINDMR